MNALIGLLRLIVCGQSGVVPQILGVYYKAFIVHLRLAKEKGRGGEGRRRAGKGKGIWEGRG